jgi:hypothetical protein
LARYNKQFANMESMVGQSKSLKTSFYFWASRINGTRARQPVSNFKNHG